MSTSDENRKDQETQDGAGEPSQDSSTGGVSSARSIVTPARPTPTPTNPQPKPGNSTGTNPNT